MWFTLMDRCQRWWKSPTGGCSASSRAPLSLLQHLRHLRWVLMYTTPDSGGLVGVVSALSCWCQESQKSVVFHNPIFSSLGYWFWAVHQIIWTRVWFFNHHSNHWPAVALSRIQFSVGPVDVLHVDPSIIIGHSQTITSSHLLRGAIM